MIEKPDDLSVEDKWTDEQLKQIDQTLGIVNDHGYRIDRLLNRIKDTRTPESQRE